MVPGGAGVVRGCRASTELGVRVESDRLSMRALHGSVCAMPDSRRTGGAGGGPDYGWLYGGRGGQPQPTRGGSQDPEPTRMLARTVRPIESAPPPKQPRRRRRVGKILLLVLLAWVVFLVAVPLWAWSNIDDVGIEPGGARPGDQPGATYLLVGSDSRRGLSASENRRFGTGGVGDIGQRADTIMLLHTGAGPSLLLSIPRDSLVEVPGRGRTKINSAFGAGGPKLLVKTIEQNTGVRIDDYVEIGFGGFVNLVDAVGGVTVCPKERMVDPKANLRISKGCQQVGGPKALGYARSRYVSRYGDIDRARRQREVVSAIGSEVKSPWTFLNPLRYFRVNQAASSSLRTSTGMGPVAFARFGLAMTRVNGTRGLTCAMPIADQEINWDRERALALLKFIKEDRTGDIPQRLCTPTGLPGVSQ